MNNILPRASYPKHSISPSLQIHRLSAVLVLIIIICAQLMTFEKLVPILDNYALFQLKNNGQSIASILVILEVMALPYLLRMSLSPLFRIVSCGMGILACMIWLLFVGFQIGGQFNVNVLPIFGGFFASSSLLTISTTLLMVCTVGSAVWRLRKDVSYAA